MARDAFLPHAVRPHAADALKLIGVWTAWFWSLNWNTIGAFLSAVFTLLLILDKLGVLAPARARILGFWRRLAGDRAPPAIGVGEPPQ